MVVDKTRYAIHWHWSCVDCIKEEISEIETNIEDEYEEIESNEHSETLLEEAVETNKEENYNIYRLLTEKDTMILKKLGVDLEDKEYTRDEFLTILSKVNHHALSIFGTGMTRKEGLQLYKRICKIIYENIKFF